LDSLLGPGWRDQIKIDELEITETSKAPSETEPDDKETFYDRVRKAGDEVDMGWLHAEYDEQADDQSNEAIPTGKRPSIRELLEDLLDCLKTKN
jgi:hypothetical protein